ncbi:MAG: RNA repair transcriptional activator RtcR, partial [Desulfuromonadaceae bacterium]
ERWRPTVALCQQEDLLIDRFELLYQSRYRKLLDDLTADIGLVSPETEVVPHLLELEDPWDFENVFAALHQFARNYPFDPEHEDYLVHITTGTHVVQICLFLLTEARYFPARLLQTSPSRNSEQLVSGEYSIIDLDLSRYDRIASRFNQEKSDDISFLKSGIETRNPLFNRLIERIEKVAMHALDPILITGPTGAGKSQLARRIFELKKARRQVRGAFVEVNCATLRGDGAMSTLFGHRRGAFTGALQDRQGLLRAADGGLLFLDEVGELGLDEQTMLLRAVEEKRFMPLGSDQEVESDFQLLCGTNRDLYREVAAGRFREDLLARINLWSFALPGLAERPEDIEPNLDYELDRFARRSGNRITMNREARRLFLKFAESGGATWPANFRDLNGAVIRMATLAPAGRITPETVQEEIARLRQAWQARSSDAAQLLLTEVLGREAAERLDLFDRAQLAAVLKVCRASKNLSAAGRVLFAVSREGKKQPNDADRLRKYLARFDLNWADLAASESDSGS